jgi:GNAT superfamily N-acetyltransferase
MQRPVVAREVNAAGAANRGVAGPVPSIRRLRRVDLHELTPIACQAFRQNAFYRQALGLDEEQFNRYWKAFLALALSDSACRVYGATTESGLAGAIVIGLHGFPRPFTGLRFLCALLTRLGPRRLARYLRFVRAYDRAMDRPEEELRVEGRGLWFFVGGDAQARGLGRRLVEFAEQSLRRDGVRLTTGFVDGGNARLLRFYRRLGYSVSKPFMFLGSQAARIEKRTGEPC